MRVKKTEGIAAHVVETMHRVLVRAPKSAWRRLASIVEEDRGTISLMRMRVARRSMSSGQGWDTGANEFLLPM